MKQMLVRARLSKVRPINTRAEVWENRRGVSRCTKETGRKPVWGVRVLDQEPQGGHQGDQDAQHMWSVPDYRFIYRRDVFQENVTEVVDNLNEVKSSAKAKWRKDYKDTYCHLQHTTYQSNTLGFQVFRFTELTRQYSMWSVTTLLDGLERYLMVLNCH